MAVFHPCEDLIVQHWVKNNSAEATGISGGLESLCNTGISNSFFILYLTLNVNLVILVKKQMA